MHKLGAIFYLFLFSISNQKVNAQEEALAIEERKSWGIGMNAGTNAYFNGFSLLLFYQKDRDQLEVELNSRYNFNVFTLKYCYYPNVWKKNFDLRIETGINLMFINSSFYNRRIRPFVGYGMRFKVLRHFYLTHGGNVGLQYTNVPRGYPEYYRFNSTVNLSVGLLFNLGSLRWKRK